MHPQPAKSSHDVRTLTLEDIPAYVALRRHMLVESPKAFVSDPQTDQGGNEANLRQRIPSEGFAIVGGFRDHRLVAAAGLMREARAKVAHRASIWGVWVEPGSRGLGIGRAVVAHAIAVARTWHGLRSVGLSASVSQSAAITLYQSLGFSTWGREPDCMCVDGEFLDEVHMQLVLDRT